MNVLIIGGGVFLGRAVTDALLSTGHSVTHFNRGKSTAPRSDVETVAGDRLEHLDRLQRRRFDAVVDTCAYVPRAVEISTQTLLASVERYVLISTLSVYDYDVATPETRIDETWHRVGLPAGASRDVMAAETYGALKALCEDVVLQSYGERALVLRCGLLVGPYDPTNRFTYWLTRAARGGRMLAPVSPDSPMQFIDVRDVARFTVRVLENHFEGAVNLTGIPASVTLGDVINTASTIAGSHPDVHWLDTDAIERAGLQEWSDLPLWVRDARFSRIFHNVRIDRALGAGLEFRPLDETVRDTLAWAACTLDRPTPHGMTLEREAEALASVEGVQQ